MAVFSVKSRGNVVLEICNYEQELTKAGNFTSSHFPVELGGEQELKVC